jgi:tripartite-type tricarboxylate transporter receptor subunit TctC
MKLPRRKFMHLAAGAAALPAFSRTASALDYPTRPVRIIVGFPPGGGADIAARLIGQSLSERLGQSFVTENRPGAGSNIGTEAVVRAPPDGYTLLLINLPVNAVNGALYGNLKFDFVRDIAPVASLSTSPQVMEVNPSIPVNTVPEFIAYARANPGKINFASGGVGTVQHLAGELFNKMTGVAMNHIPYRGAAPGLTDLLAGRVQVMFDVTASSIEYIKAGKLRALAVTTVRRSDALPGLPAIGDFVPGYETSNIRGVGAPRNTQKEIIEKLNGEINAALGEPKMIAQLANLGETVLTLPPDKFAKIIAEETEKWDDLVRVMNIKAE